MAEKTSSKNSRGKKSWRKWLSPSQLVSDKVKWRWLDSFDHVYLKLLRYIHHVVVGVAVIIVGVTIVTLTFRRTPRTADELRSEYHAGLVANDYRRASAALEELTAQSPSALDLTFDKAYLEHELGDKQAAQKLFEELTQSGHGRAAVWLMNDEFHQQDFSTLTDEQIKRFNELLILSKNVTLPTDKVIVNELAARFCLAQGKTEQAITHLRELVKDRPASHRALATAYEQLNRPEEAQEHLRKSRDYLTKELALAPESNELRQQLIEVHIKLKEEKDAVNVAFRGFQLTRDPQFQQTAAQILLQWAGRLKLENADLSLEDRLVLVHNSTQYAPQDPAVVSALQDLLVECHNTPNFEERATRVLASGMAVEAMHFILGLHYLMHEAVEQGVQHLEQAEARKAVITPVLYTFLLKYSSEGSAQHTRALAIVKKLHEHAPDDKFLEQAYTELKDK